MEHHYPPHATNMQHFVGYVETTTDALRLIMAARQGIIPRITRRLNDSERRSMIKSGSVFVFCVEESGIKRWTEGLSWSPSRIVGNFLMYREITERSSIRGSETVLPTPGTSSFSLSPPIGSRGESGAGAGSVLDPAGTTQLNGLIKKTITVKVEATDHHLVSYYRHEDVRLGRLLRPTARPDIMALSIPPEMVRSTNFRHPPHIEVGPDGRAQIYDAEEADSSKRQQDRASSSPASQSTYAATSPTPHLATRSTVPQRPNSSARSSSNINTHSHPDSTHDASDTSYSGMSGTHHGLTSMRPAYHLSPSSPLPPPNELQHREGAAQSMRSPTPWAQRDHEPHPAAPRYPTQGYYYQQRVRPELPDPTLTHPEATHSTTTTNRHPYYTSQAEGHYSPDVFQYSTRQTYSPAPYHSYSPFTSPKGHETESQPSVHHAGLATSTSTSVPWSSAPHIPSPYISHRAVSQRSENPEAYPEDRAPCLADHHDSTYGGEGRRS